MTNMLARAHKATGDMVSAVVLLRVVFRYRQAISMGKDWTAQSYSNLMDETGCSQKQIRRAIEKLKALDFVETKRGLFGNKNVLHFRVTQKAQYALEGVFEHALEGSFEAAPEGHFYIQGETTGSNNMEKHSEHSPAMENPGKLQGSGKVGTMIRLPPKKNRKSVNASAGEAKPLSVLDVAAKVKAKTILHKPDSVTELKYAWMQGLHEYHGIVSTVLTAKQMGMLKHFLKKCPPGTAEAAMNVALSDWIKFVKTVESAMGIKTTPAQPKLEFLLTYAGVAVNLIAQSKKSTPSKQEADTGMISETSVQLISQPAEPAESAPQTLDELLGILGGAD